MEQQFMKSLLTFYMKSTIKIEENFLKTKDPGLFLKVIPLGYKNKTIPFAQISSVNEAFYVDVKSLVWGIIVFIIGILTLVVGIGVVFLIYAVLTIISSFQSVLEVQLTSGGTYKIDVLILEKAKLQEVIAKLEETIANQYNKK